MQSACAVLYFITGCKIFLHIISQKTRFSKKKKNVTEHEMRVLIFSTNFNF